MAQLDKMDPRRAKSAPGAIELNRHFGAETDLLNLQCSVQYIGGKQIESSFSLNVTEKKLLNIATLFCILKFFLYHFTVEIYFDIQQGVAVANCTNY